MGDWCWRVVKCVIQQSVSARVCPKLIDPRQAWRVVSPTRRPVSESRVKATNFAYELFFRVRRLAVNGWTFDMQAAAEVDSDSRRFWLLRAVSILL